MSGEPAFHAAAAAATDQPLVLEALGQKFVLGDGPDAITWLELAAAAGKSNRSREGATAFLNFARACFTDKSWPKFRAAIAGIKDQEEIEELVGQALELIEGRPTMPSSDSASGSSSTSPPSTETSTTAAPVAVAS